MKKIELQCQDGDGVNTIGCGSLGIIPKRLIDLVKELSVLWKSTDQYKTYTTNFDGFRLVDGNESVTVILKGEKMIKGKENEGIKGIGEDVMENYG